MAKHAPSSIPVEPNSVRVWRGFRNPAVAWPDFTHFLAATMFPVEATWRPWFGLTAYVAGIKPESGDSRAPDEFALVFYESQQVYASGLETVAGSLYPIFPTANFDAQRSKSGYPQPFAGTLAPGQAYYVFEGEVDWHHGDVCCLVGTMPADTSSATLCSQVAEILQRLQRSRPANLDAFIVAVDENPDGTSMIAWQHSHGAAIDQGPLDELARLVDVVFRHVAEPMQVSGGFYDSGVTTTPTPAGDQLLRLSFERRLERIRAGASVWGPVPGP